VLKRGARAICSSWGSSSSVGSEKATSLPPLKPALVWPSQPRRARQSSGWKNLAGQRSIFTDWASGVLGSLTIATEQLDWSRQLSLQVLPGANSSRVAPPSLRLVLRQLVPLPQPNHDDAPPSASLLAEDDHGHLRDLRRGIEHDIPS